MRRASRRRAGRQLSRRRRAGSGCPRTDRAALTQSAARPRLDLDRRQSRSRSGSDIGGIFAKTLSLGPLTFRHEPTGADGEIAGHLHPSARITWRGRSVVRRCFAANSKLRGDAGVRRLYRRAVDPRPRLRRRFRRAGIFRACARRAARLRVFVGALPVARAGRSLSPCGTHRREPSGQQREPTVVKP